MNATRAAVAAADNGDDGDDDDDASEFLINATEFLSPRAVKHVYSYTYIRASIAFLSGLTYTMSQIWTVLLLSTTSPNIDRLSQFVHGQTFTYGVIK